jgi:hypothetical protein
VRGGGTPPGAARSRRNRYVPTMRNSTGLLPLRPAGSGLTAGLAVALLLTGCAGDGGSDEKAAESSASTSSAGRTPPPDLSSGLLQAGSFGPEAAVVAVTIDQLRAGTGLAAVAKDLTVTPASCASTVQGTQPDLDAFDDVAGVSATSGSTVTVEMLMRGGPTDGAVEQLGGAATRCPQATITSPKLGRITVEFADLPVAGLGDASAAMRYTTSVPMPDGTRTTVPALVGAVEDGDRLLVLVSLAKPGGAAPASGGSAAPGTAVPAGLDPDAFEQLLRKAYQTQADALG